MFPPQVGSLGGRVPPTVRRTVCRTTLRGTLVLRAVTVNRVNGYNLDMVSAADMRRRTQPEAEPAHRATRSATRSGCERNGEWLEGHSTTSAPAAAAISRWLSGWIIRSPADTT